MGVFTTAATTWAVGNKITAAQLNGQVRDLINGFGAFTAYTPTLTGFTLGNGTVTGAYTQVNKTVLFRVRFVFGTTSAAAAAFPTFTLPVTATGSGSIQNAVLWAQFTDASPATAYMAWGQLASTTTVQAGIPGTNGLRGTPSTTSPFTWTTSDSVEINGVYEAA